MCAVTSQVLPKFWNSLAMVTTEWLLKPTLKFNKQQRDLKSESFLSNTHEESVPSKKNKFETKVLVSL